MHIEYIIFWMQQQEYEVFLYMFISRTCHLEIYEHT
jgi:hypothetical protein